eukprot:scpid94445/ scgid19706/ 
MLQYYQECGSELIYYHHIHAINPRCTCGSFWEAAILFPSPVIRCAVRLCKSDERLYALLQNMTFLINFVFWKHCKNFKSKGSFGESELPEKPVAIDRIEYCS